MRRPTKRLLLLVISLPLIVVGLALIYQAGMARLEGETRTFWEAVEWASETLTSTGYGQDNHWNHPVMVVFVSLAQLAGASLLLLVWGVRANDRFTLGAGVLAGLCTAFVWRAERAADP